MRLRLFPIPKVVISEVFHCALLHPSHRVRHVPQAVPSPCGTAMCACGGPGEPVHVPMGQSGRFALSSYITIHPFPLMGCGWVDICGMHHAQVEQGQLGWGQLAQDQHAVQFICCIMMHVAHYTQF